MNDFVRQFAIRMPNGQFYGTPVRGEPVPDYSVNSAERDMFSGLFSFFGGGTTPAEGPVIGYEPVIYPTREAAQKQLIELRKQAEQFGVTNWGGIVVERLCTPFTSYDPGVQFLHAITAWMEQNIGGAR